MKKLHIVWLHWYDMSNTGKAVVMEQKLKDSKGKDEGRQVSGKEQGSFLLKKLKPIL